MVAGLSLSNKSQLLFGVVMLTILAAALSVPYILARTVVREGQFEAARQLADAWLTARIHLGLVERPGGLSQPLETFFDDPDEESSLRMTLTYVDEIEPQDEERQFLASAIEAFEDDEALTEYTGTTELSGRPIYRYARVLRESQMRAIRDRSVMEFSAPPFEPGIANPIRAVLVIDRRSPFAEGQLLRSRIYIIAAGLVAGLSAVGAFYLILTKLIFSPVRRLRETAEKVQAGDLTIRSQIQTGDEFEQLAEAFNTMLDHVEQSQSRLRSLNESLDLKLNELSETNIGLYESNRLKSEFLANVSHELRTPLNSIIGFTEVLDELAQAERDADPKRLRYIQNILSSGRSLLDMINELLEMAKIEAGRLEVNIEPTSVSDLAEGLVGIMGQQAESKQITIKLELARNVPLIETDPGKLQQILYNFLSNAIKFTPTGGSITIAADRLARQNRKPCVRIGVADTGPGVPHDLQDAIFDKFRQADTGHTRSHTGTGLGLAICRELADLLGATVSLVSEPECGATFYVDLPVTYQPEEPQPLMA